MNGPIARRLALLLVLAAGASCDRVDPTLPRAYTCDPAAGDGQCPGGWHCAVDGVCHDPATGTPCLQDSDCVAGQHCGAEQRCYALADAGAISCRPDGGDCAPGWRCGLEAICHPTTVALPYACGEDSDCEQGWRCGPGAHCLDAGVDSLVAPPSPPEALDIQPISPLFPPPPGLFASSPNNGYFNFSDFCGRYGSSDALITGLRVTVRNNFGPCYLLNHLDPLPEISFDVPPPAPSAVAVDGMNVFLLDDAGTSEFRWDFDGGTLRRLPTPALTNGALRLLAVGGNAAPEAIAVGAEGYALLPNDTQVRTIANLGGQPQPVLDAVPLVPYSADPTVFPSLMFSTPEGLFFAASNTSGFLDATGSPSPDPVPQALDLPGVFPNAHCGAPGPGLRLRALKGDGTAPGVAAEVEMADGGVGFVFLGRDGTDLTACGPMDFSVLGPVPACPHGGALLDYVVSSGSFYDLPDAGRAFAPRIEARCRNGHTESFQQYEVTADEIFDEGESYGTQVQTAEVTAASSSWFASMVDKVGVGWTCTYANCQPDRPVSFTTVLSEPPRSVVGNYVDGMLAVLRDGAQIPYDPAFGFTGSPGTDAPCSPVRGGDTLGVGCPDQGSVTLWALGDSSSSPYATLSGSLGVELPTHQRGDRAPAISITLDEAGDSVLLVGAGDTLWVGPAGGDLTAEVAPAPGTSIEGLWASLTTTALPDGGMTAPSGDGYVLGAGRLFALHASDLHHWKSTELSLPTLPLALWGDGPAARLGFADGTVLSLPSQVPIAPPLPSPVQDFASHCGASYALTRSQALSPGVASGGLFQLAANPDGGPVGAWLPVDVAAALGTSTPGALDDGRLISTDTELLLFTADGTTVRLVAPECE